MKYLLNDRESRGVRFTLRRYRQDYQACPEEDEDLFTGKWRPKIAPTKAPRKVVTPPPSAAATTTTAALLDQVDPKLLKVLPGASSPKLVFPQCGPFV